MRTKLLAATALAGSLLFMPMMSAHSATLPSLPSHQTDLTLISHGGGGGGGGGGSGGPHGMGGMGGNGPHAMGGNGPHAMGGNGPHMHSMNNGPHMHNGNFAENGGRNFRRGNNGEFTQHNDRARNRFAEGDHDHDFDHHHGHGHRVFRNGVWVWAYGPDYYAYGDCSWLLRRAEVTGSPYWWNRYDACTGYY